MAAEKSVEITFEGQRIDSYLYGIVNNEVK